MSRHTHRSRWGFSLLELSVALVVVSLVVGFGVTGGKNALEGSDRVTSQQRLQTIKKALDNYAKQNGYLPCPARRDQVPSSATFGMEVRSGANCAPAGDVKSVPATTPTTYIGAVPTRTLGLPDAYGADSWSNKFLYAVGINMTASPYATMTSDGPITIKYGNRTGTNYAITTDRAGSPGAAATYIVVSHGPDAKGAYPLNGTAAAKACGTSSNNDVENCDEKDATFYDTKYNAGNNPAAFFDDYIVWASNSLERSPLVVQDASSSGTCLSGGGLACEYDINAQGTAPDCDVTCSTAGYSASGASVTNCTYNSTACTTGNHMRCNYQCCCSGTPSQGCAATTANWGSGQCAGDVPDLPHGGTATIINAIAGYNGSETATCTNGTLSYNTPTCTAQAVTSSSTSTSSSGTNVVNSSTSSSTGGLAGCSTGNCQEWCAPCSVGGGGKRFGGTICEKVLISTSPCRAYCIRAGCGWGWRGGYMCTECP